MQVRVECYSGYKGDERPVRFQVRERTFIVEELLDRWYGPEEAYFKVKADDGNTYILRQSRMDVWTLEAFRRTGQ